MSDQHAQGTVNKAIGSIEAWFGKLTGSRKTQAKGDVKQVQGSVQQGAAEVQDAVAGATDTKS